jgi:hypothetical protein
MIPLPSPPSFLSFPIPLSTWPANFMQFSPCPKHPTHSATTPSPHTHTVIERDCHLKANFLSLSYHLLCCNTGGSNAMWTISTSTNNTHWAAITHPRCRDQVSPKNQAHSPHLHESHCPGITCALQIPTLIMNCNCTLFFYMWNHILKRKKDVALIMWYTELTLLLLYIQNPLKRNASKTTKRIKKLWSVYQTSHHILATIKFTLIILCFKVSDWTFLSHKYLPPHLLFYITFYWF